jgi:outer membrane protein TolC
MAEPLPIPAAPAEADRTAPPAPATPPGPAPADGAAPGPAPASLTVSSLADLLDLALRSDPGTRAAWYDARSAAANAGSKRAAYLPTLDAQGNLLRGEGISSTMLRTDATLSAQLSWLLVDLGARGATRDEADRQLLAARLAHESAAQELALTVEESWIGCQTAAALLVSSAASIKQAEASLQAAEERRRAGAATVADVLQARTALSQLRLERQRLEGTTARLQGSLASSAGFPPTTRLSIPALPEELPATSVLPGIERLLEEGLRRNPDLARARALADAADAKADAAARADLPTLSANGSAGRDWRLAPTCDAAPGASCDGFGFWAAGLVLKVPLFYGGRTSYDAAAAREGAEAAHQRAEAAGRRNQLDVWSSYQSLKAAGQRIETARDLRASAVEGLAVAEGRYKEGLGSILDLLSTQASLETARAEEILARGEWMLALARLARATGRTLRDTPGAAP